MQQLIEQLAQQANLPLAAGLAQKLSCHWQLLAEANSHFNITAITDPTAAAEKHYLEMCIRDRAVRSGRRVELEPMNPHERRIVHIALQNDKRVETASHGEEPYRRVVITAKRHKRGGGQHKTERQGEQLPQVIITHDTDDEQ